MKRVRVVGWFFFILVCLPIVASAGNVDTFGIGSKATALGGAYTAYADGPFAVYYNPAGLTQIKRPMVSTGAEILDPTLKMHNYEAIDGDNKPVYPYDVSFKDTSPNLVIPHTGLVVPVSDKVVLAIASYVPYGLHIRWEDDPNKNPGAYNSFESYYVRAVVAPTIAYKLSDKFSVGFGVSIGRSWSGTQRRLYAPGMYVDGKYLDGRVVKGTLMDAVNYSYNIGIMYKPSEDLTFGLTYRSMTHTHFSGTVEVEGVQKVGAKTSIDHPDQVQFGVRYMPTKNLSLEADILWTHWNLIDSYTIYFDKPLLGMTKEYFPRDWKNTVEAKFGVEWKASELLTLRAGYYYDPSPIPTHTFDLLWPDGNKNMYSVGAGLNFGKIKVDLVVQYIVASNTREINSGDSEELDSSYKDLLTGNPGSVSGEANGHLWGYGLTVSYIF